jgi:hypothetical protein
MHIICGDIYEKALFGLIFHVQSEEKPTEIVA